MKICTIAVKYSVDVWHGLYLSSFVQLGQILFVKQIEIFKAKFYELANFTFDKRDLNNQLREGEGFQHSIKKA